MLFISLLLLFIISVNLLGKENFTNTWKCPNTFDTCPKGCKKQKTPEYNCSKKIYYDGPNKCVKKCKYICTNKDTCQNNDCCKYCGDSWVNTSCGILTSTK